MNQTSKKNTINYLEHAIFRLAEAAEELLPLPLAEFTYAIEIIHLKDDAIRFEHSLTQGTMHSKTHGYEHLFNIGLLLWEALLYDYAIEWQLLEIKFSKNSKQKLVWQMLLDGKVAHFE